jgi:hypothetical protein
MGEMDRYQKLSANAHLPEHQPNSSDVNVLALIKGPERYFFMYTEEQKTEMLRTLGRYAADPELSFSWYDAAVLSQKVRELDK